MAAEPEYRPREGKKDKTRTPPPAAGRQNRRIRHPKSSIRFMGRPPAPALIRQPSDKERHRLSQSRFRWMSLALKRRHPMMAGRDTGDMEWLGATGTRRNGRASCERLR